MVMGNVFAVCVLCLSLRYVGFQEAPLGRLFCAVMLLHYIIASFLFSWPLRNVRTNTFKSQDMILSSPMRELNRDKDRRAKVSTPQANSRLSQPEGIQYTSYSVPPVESSHATKPSYSTIASSLHTADPFLDGDGVPTSEVDTKSGCVPFILIQQDTLSTRDGRNIRRPESAASTSISHATSQISMDSDQIHTATARLMEASLGLKQSGQARLVRMSSTSCSPIFPTFKDHNTLSPGHPSFPDQSLLSPVPPRKLDYFFQQAPEALASEEDTAIMSQESGLKEELDQETSGMKVKRKLTQRKPICHVESSQQQQQQQHIRTATSERLSTAPTTDGTAAPRFGTLHSATDRRPATTENVHRRPSLTEIHSSREALPPRSPPPRSALPLLPSALERPVTK
ncbi:hypothetical protein CBS101457_006583 [Exobasidium rhododendri]|nr:hypothetical protein CBS101457_006583 [Exobasidium rhododendri]